MHCEHCRIPFLPSKDCRQYHQHCTKFHDFFFGSDYLLVWAFRLCTRDEWCKEVKNGWSLEIESQYLISLNYIHWQLLFPGFFFSTRWRGAHLLVVPLLVLPIPLLMSINQVHSGKGYDRTSLPTWWNRILPIQAQHVECCKAISLLHVRLVQKLQKLFKLYSHNSTNIQVLWPSINSVFKLLIKICPKLKFKKEVIFWRFLEGKNRQIHIFGFH
jgi:hypothetical protein